MFFVLVLLNRLTNLTAESSKRFVIVYFYTLCVGWLLSMMAFAAASELKSNDFTPARLIKTVDTLSPYSKLAALNFGSAVVELTYMVDKSGKPVNIEVLRSSHSVFNRNAVYTLKRYRYESATYKGEPVPSRQKISIDFPPRLKRFNVFRGVGDEIFYLYINGNKFVLLFNELSTELGKSNPNQVKAEKLLRRLKRLKRKSLTVLFGIELMRYEYALKFDYPLKQFEALQNMSMYMNTERVDLESFSADMRSRIDSSLLHNLTSLGFYADALNQHQRMLASDPLTADLFLKSIEGIRSLKNDRSVVTNELTLSSRGTVFLNLFKPSFSLQAENGEIDSYLLRCDTKFKRLDHNQENTYTIPASWGQCQLQLNGSEGARVTVLQQ